MPSHGIKQGAVRGVGYAHSRQPITEAETLRDFGMPFTSLWNFQVPVTPNATSIPSVTVVPDLITAAPAVPLTVINANPWLPSIFANRGGIEIADGSVSRFANLGVTRYDVLAGDSATWPMIVRLGADPGLTRDIGGKVGAGVVVYYVFRFVLGGQIQFVTRDTLAVIRSSLVALDHSNSYQAIIPFFDRGLGVQGIQTLRGLATTSIAGATAISDSTAGINNFWLGRSLAVLAGNATWTLALAVLAAPSPDIATLFRNFWRGWRGIKSS